MEKHNIGVHPYSPHLGTEISGVDMAAPLADRTVRKIEHALWAHGVILFAIRKSPLSNI